MSLRVEIKRLMYELEVSQHFLSKASGVSQCTISRFLKSRDEDPDLETRLMAVLNQQMEPIQSAYDTCYDACQGIPLMHARRMLRHLLTDLGSER